MEPNSQPNNPLHGVKLADVLDHLVERYGWETLGVRIDIRCFNYDPSIKSSLKFLRKTPWARDKVEQLYLRSIKTKAPIKSKTKIEKKPIKEQKSTKEENPRSKRKYGFKKR